MSGYTPKSPEHDSPVKNKNVNFERSQQPDDPDSEDILTSKCPAGAADDTCRTFIFKNQGHTLGNVLRDQMLKYPEVHFCGYSIPHPGENVMHLRVQTNPGTTSANDMLRKALEDVIEMCDHVEGLFQNELDKNEYATT